MDPITGETAATVLSPTRIAADPPLTAHGVDQANELATHLAALQPPIDAVYSSPYYRCLQTISPFVTLGKDRSGRRTGRGSGPGPVTIRAERGLSEFYGAAPFDHPVPAEITFLKRLFPSIDEDYQSRVVPSRKGESIEALYERVRSAVENIIEQCDAEGHRSVILCTHAAVVIALGRVLTGDIPKTVDVVDFGAFTCGLSVFRRSKHGSRAQPHQQDQGANRPDARALENRSHQVRHGSSDAEAEAQRIGSWVCDANSDCSFLSGGQERGWYVLKPSRTNALIIRPAFVPPPCSPLTLVCPPVCPLRPLFSRVRLVNAPHTPHRRLTHCTGRSAVTRHSR